MARKSDYFGLSYLDGKILAAILRLVLGWNIIWLIDLILMIVSKHILRIIPI